MFEASTVCQLHFSKLAEVSSKSLPFGFYASFFEQHNVSIRSCNNIVLRERNSKRNLVIYCTAKPEPQPIPSEGKQAPWWRDWTLGALLSVGLPFFTNSMGSLVNIRSEFERKLQTTEDIVEEIKRGAMEIEKRAEQRMEVYLKHDAGVPRRVMVYIESAAERIAKTACSVDRIIDVIQDIFLLDSPDNDQARKLYRAEKDKKEKALKLEKEEKDRKEKAMEVEKEENDRTEKAMEEKDKKEKALKIEKEEKDRKEKAMEVEKEENDRTEKAMEEKDKKERAMEVEKEKNDRKENAIEVEEDRREGSK